MKRFLLLLLWAAMGVLSVPAAPSRAGPYETEDCIRCHRPGSPESTLHVPVGVFQASVHGGETECWDCHADSRGEDHLGRRVVQAVDCSRCHDQTNRHGGIGARAPLPECFECHTKHSILPASDPSSTVHDRNLVRTCGGCHPREAGRRDLLGSVLSFRPAGHRKGDLAGTFEPGRCLDCHQGKGAHGEEAPLNEKRCGRCHDPALSGRSLLGTFHGSPGVGSRPAGWIGAFYYVLLLVPGVAFLFGGLWRRSRSWRSGRPEHRSDRKRERLAGLIRFALLQRRVFEDPWAGLAHLGIALGVAVPFLFVLAAQVRFAAPTWLSNAGSLALDLSGLCGVAGVVATVIRRARGPRAARPSGTGGWVLLGVLLAVFLSGFLVGGARAGVGGGEAVGWAPVRFLVASSIHVSPLVTAYLWRVHFLLALGLLAFLPFSRIRHIVTAPLNIYHRRLGPTGAARPIELKRGGPLGASEWRELTWKQLLDADTCTECGRCEERCPATLSGKALSPRRVVQAVRDQMEEGRHGLHIRKPVRLIGERIPEEAIWACTTCHACEFACPVFVEPVQTVIDLRRHLVLAESRFPGEVKQVFRRLEIFGDPYGKGPSRRLEWARNVKVKDLGRGADAEVLLWVGCEGAFHSRYRQVPVALAKVLLAAGLDFGVLGSKERCCGDVARRVGNEYLYERLARQNIDLIRDMGIRKIITLCPHCFHVLKNEYPLLGGSFEVLHYTEVLSGLLDQGGLEAGVAVSGRLTFHDPCYLGRINGLVEAPRRVLARVRGAELVEMDRSSERALCCGAGGGRVWMHEQTGRRMNRIRAEEALAVSVEAVVTSCPYCLAMFEDALGTLGEGRVRVRDLAEVVCQSLGL